MRVFIAHRLTGENLPELQKQLEQLSDIVSALGHKPFIFWRDIEEWVPNALPMEQILEQCLAEIDKSDMVFVFAHSDEKSEGMLIECGYAKARNKRFIVAIREGVQQQWLQYLGDTTLHFENIHDLSTKMKKAFTYE